MATLYFFIYNNYENRRLLIENSIEDYGGIFYQESNNLNFNPNDGITTTYTAGRQGNPYNGACNYVIYSEDGTTISSRWFIIEQTRTLQGQYRLTLKRDILADNWYNVINADCFIEKATLQDSDPLIYNKEDMTLNQIKQGPDKLIKDETGVPWIVGYFAPGKEYTVSTDTGEAEYTVTNQSDLPYYDYVNNDFLSYPSDWRYEVAAKGKTDQLSNPTICFKIGPNVQSTIRGVLDWIEDGYDYPLQAEYTKKTQSGIYKEYEWIYAPQIWSAVNKAQLEDAISSYLDTKTPAETDKLLGISGKTYFVTSTGKYYQASIVSQGSKTTSAFCQGLGNQILQAGISQIDGLSGNLDDKSAKVFGTSTAYRVVYTEVQVSGGKVSLTIPSDTRKLDDAPYGMFAIPYGDLPIYKGTALYCRTDKNAGMTIATTLASSNSGVGGVYDLQLVPYCPVREAFTTSTGAITGFDLTNEGVLAYDINIDDKVKSVCFIAKTSTFGFALSEYALYDNKKIANQTEVYRIVSPNYNGQFEFNIAMNEGLSGYNIDCTYKPYQPYIQVAPKFAGLYGADYQDSRGLICGGDFSLPIVTNAWEQYQLQNKNYQAMFDRQIQNMEVNQKYGRLQQAIGAGVGALTTGIGAGIVTGNVGVGIGAGVASGLGGIADYAINKVLQAEAIDYAKDNFGYQLGNIQALPNSLTKVSAFVANNKIFPFLEHYTCTDEEKEALAQKIAINGMTVMKIGKIIDYLSNKWQYKINGKTIKSRGYVKAKLIRYKGIGDAHEQAAIAEELNKGVFTL